MSEAAGFHVRVLRPGDEPHVDALLAAYADSSLFLRRNLAVTGLVDRGERYHGTWAGAFEDGRLVAVAQHTRFGSSLFYQYLPFWVATLIERMLIIIAPLVVVLVPLSSYLPKVRTWWVRSRIYRWYGELALLEREVSTREGALPIAKWLATLDRVEHAVAGVKAPASFASEAYTLREHIALVRRAVLARSAVSPATHEISAQEPAIRV